MEWGRSDGRSGTASTHPIVLRHSFLGSSPTTWGVRTMVPSWKSGLAGWRGIGAATVRCPRRNPRPRRLSWEGLEVRNLLSPLTLTVIDTGDSASDGTGTNG